MNRKQRTELDDALKTLNDAKSVIERIAEEEREKVDNMSDTLSGTERYQEMEAGAEALESANYALDEAISQIEEVLG